MSADWIDIDSLDLHLDYTEPDAYPFFIIDETLCINLEKHQQTHGDLLYWLADKERQKSPKLYRDIDDSKLVDKLKAIEGNISGRIWIKSRLISFWEYPPIHIFKDILNKFSEIGVDLAWVYIYKSLQVQEIIPVDEYGESVWNHGFPGLKEAIQKLKEQHTLCPMEKNKQKRAEILSNPGYEIPYQKAPSDLGEVSMAEYNFHKANGTD